MPWFDAVMLRICLRARVPFRATVFCSVRACTLEKMTTSLGVAELEPRDTAKAIPPATSTTATTTAMIFWLRVTHEPPGISYELWPCALAAHSCRSGLEMRLCPGGGVICSDEPPPVPPKEKSSPFEFGVGVGIPHPRPIMHVRHLR